MQRAPAWPHFFAVVVGLGGSCLFTGCASYFQTTYKPAPARSGPLVAPPATPGFAWSTDLDRDGKQLAQQGYMLLGTSHYDHSTDLRFAGELAVAQGKRVGAAGCIYSCDVAFSHPIGPFFASYWAKAAPAEK
jgi:hypothetical protein